MTPYSRQEEMALLQEAVDNGYSPLEYRACQIGLIYQRIRREFFDQPYTCLNTARDKRKSKGFPHFYKLAQIEKENRGLIPDISLYIRGQFEIAKQKCGVLENFTPIPPQHLHGRRAFERYREYIIKLQSQETYHHSQKPRSETRVIIRALGKTGLTLTKLQKDLFGHTQVDWWALMTYKNETDHLPIFFLLTIQGLVSRYFLSASKTYPRWLASIDPEAQAELPDDLPVYREILLSDPRALAFGREVFGAEFAL